MSDPALATDHAPPPNSTSHRQLGGAAMRWVVLTPGPKHRLDAVIDAQFYALQELVAIRQRERNGDDLSPPGPAAHEAAGDPAKGRRRKSPETVAKMRALWTPERRAAQAVRARAIGFGSKVGGNR